MLPFKSTKTCWLVSQVVLRRKGLTSKTQVPGEEQLPVFQPIPCCLRSRCLLAPSPAAWGAGTRHPTWALAHLSALQAQLGSDRPEKAGADASSWQEEGLFVLL